MSDFNIAIGPVIEHEDPGLTGAVATDNNGAAVRFGINAAANPDMPPGFYDGTMPNDRALAAAKARYKGNYWYRLSLDDIVDQAVAGKVLDMAVNMGTGEASVLFQRAINATASSVEVDGKIGPLTIAAANAVLPGPLLASLRNLSCQFYRDLAAAKPSDAKYLDGWLARARA